jgi:hypothetical protein
MGGLERSQGEYWAYTVMFLLVYVFLFYCAMTMGASVRHTYQLPASSPGVLVSDFWSWPFIREFLICVYMAGLISGFFMLMSKTRKGFNIHVVILVMLIAWFGVALAFDIVALFYKNVGPHEEGFEVVNLARDLRWCCVYGGQPGTNLLCNINATATPCPPISHQDLGTNPNFLGRFILQILIGCALVYDLLTTVFVYRPRLNFFLDKKNENKGFRR